MKKVLFAMDLLKSFSYLILRTILVKLGQGLVFHDDQISIPNPS